MHPSETLSPSADFPVLPVIRPTQLPPISQRGEEGSSSCSAYPCRHAVGFTPPEGLTAPMIAPGDAVPLPAGEVAVASGPIEDGMLPGETTAWLTR